MKSGLNKQKLGALLLTALLAAGLLVGCNKSPAAETTADYLHDYENSGDVSVSTGKTVTFIENEDSACRIVWSNHLKDGSSIITAARQLSAFITSSTGAVLEARADYLIGNEDPTAITEILIGETQREESAFVAETLRINDYAIQVVNNKLVVLGGCEAKTIEAVNKLVELYFSADRPDLVLESGYRYQYRYDYPIVDLTLDGKSILDYTLVYGEDCKGAATYLQKVLTESMGFVLPMTSSTAAATEREILIGETGRNGSVKADTGAYRIGMDNGNLVFAGNADAVSLAVRAFVDSQLSGTEKSVKVEANLSMEGSIPAFENSVKLLDLNVTLTGYAENAVVNRYPRLYQMIQAQTPDVLCLQEVSCTTWLDCIQNGIADTPALTDTYELVGTGRNGEAPDDYDAFLEGAYNAILFNKTKYKLEESGTFWLSDTPDVASVGWDGRTFAICTWAKLTEVASGDQFVVMNTQLDAYGTQAPLNGAKLIGEKAAEFDVPVILAGDFNSADNGRPHQAVCENGFADALAVAETTVSKGATKTGYGSTTQTAATSHVLVSRGMAGVKRYELLSNQTDDGYISEHRAILVEIAY